MNKKSIYNNSRFQHLEDSLYNPSDVPTRVKTGYLHPDSTDVNTDWSSLESKEKLEELNQQSMALLNQEIKVKQKSTFLRKFFVTSLLFFLVAVGFGVYAFFIKSKINPEGNISIGIVGSTFTQGGEELPLKVQIENKNNFDLEIVDLIVEYPREGDKPTSSLLTTDRERITLGTIGANKQVVKEIPIVLFGKEGDKKEINFTLEYSIANSSTIFQKLKTYQVTLSSSPVTTRIVGNPTAVPGQSYRFSVEVSTNTRKPLEHILVAVQYPAGFTYESASVEPTSQNNVWDLETLVPGAPKTIEIVGKFTGLDGDERSIRTLFGTYLPNDKTKISTNLGTLIQTVALQKPFLSTDILVNNSSNEIIPLTQGEQIQGQILWKNNSEHQILDLEIQVKLNGNLLKREKIDATEGFYNSQMDSIIWNKNTIDSFVRVPAGANGVLYFMIPTFEAGEIALGENPQVDLDVSVKAIEDTDGNTSKTIESFEKVTLRVDGNVKVKPYTLFSTGPITNSGVYPVKVNSEVTYTVGFDLTNSINKYYKGEIRAKLPPNVTFKNVFSPSSESVALDDKTGEIVWRIEDIPISSDIAKTLALQLHVIPSLTQVGEYVPLLNAVTFKAVDRFTNTPVSQNIGSITNEIKNVPGEDVLSSNGQVHK